MNANHAIGVKRALLASCLLGLVLGLSACSGGATPARSTATSSVANENQCDQPGYIPLPPGAFEVDGMKFQPPSGPQWQPCYQKQTQSDRTRVGFIHTAPWRSGLGTLNHTVVADITKTSVERVLAATPRYRDMPRADFLLEVVKGMTGVNNKERFTEVEFTTKPQTTPAADCLRFDSVVEDRGVPGQVGKVFILETRGLACYLPGPPASIVMASFGERAPQGEKRLPNLRAEGEAYLSSITFTR